MSAEDRQSDARLLQAAKQERTRRAEEEALLEQHPELLAPLTNEEEADLLRTLDPHRRHPRFSARRMGVAVAGAVAVAAALVLAVLATQPSTAELPKYALAGPPPDAVLRGGTSSRTAEPAQYSVGRLLEWTLRPDRRTGPQTQVRAFAVQGARTLEWSAEQVRRDGGAITLRAVLGSTSLPLTEGPWTLRFVLGPPGQELRLDGPGPATQRLEQRIVVRAGAER